MLVERRRSAFPAEFLLRVTIAWAVVAALLIALQWGAITGGRPAESDDILRIVQVRDLLAGQSWFDVTQYRIDAPGGGVELHWSRLVDIPLVLIIWALTPLVGGPAAETAALVIVPLFTLGLVMLLAARIAWRLMGDEEATLTALAVALCVPVLFELTPMRIDHHGWQIVCALVAVNGLMARSPKAGGWVVGTALATWLAISIEGLPLSAAVLALLAWRWLRDRNRRQWLVNAIHSFAVIGAVLFLLTRGIGIFANHCDAVSPVHLSMFAFGALVLTGVSRLEPLPRGIVLGGFFVAAGGAIGILFALAPQCVGVGIPALDPLVAQHWYSDLSEGLPIWRQSLPGAMQYAVTPVIGLFAAFGLVGQSRDWLRRFWLDYALILGAAFLISLFVARAGAVACVLAAPPLAWQVRGWLRTIRAMKRPAPRVAATAALAFALLPALPFLLLASAIPAQAALGGASPALAGSPPSKRAPTCRVEKVAAELRALEQGEFYAPLDLAPDLLLATNHSVVAAGQHRGAPSIKFVIETALGPSGQARTALQTRGTAYVIGCPGLKELRKYQRAAPRGFAADLNNQRVPGWLEPVALNGESGIRVWRVKPAR